MFTYYWKKLIIDDSLVELDAIAVFDFLAGCIATIPCDIVSLPLQLLTGIICFIHKKRRKDD